MHLIFYKDHQQVLTQSVNDTLRFLHVRIVLLSMHSLYVYRVDFGLCGINSANIKAGCILIVKDNNETITHMIHITTGT